MKVLLAHEVRAMRRKQNLSQARLANMCGVTRNTISRLERGETDSFALRYNISEALYKVWIAGSTPEAPRGIS